MTFREALLNGLAPDGGLYMPMSIPAADSDELEAFRYMKYHEVAYGILSHWITDEIEEQSLRMICKDAYDFEVPVEESGGNCHILRLDRGPTASFKDFAARMMGRIMQYFLADEKRNITILTATSGDTGSAVANAFHGLTSIDTVILFPSEEVTPLQRKQMTTLKGNVRVIAINGKFDDCQKLVKRAFRDPCLAQIPLSSANSINIGRLLPQAVYYFYAWSRVPAKSGQNAVFSVPSGNFGNLMGGLIAREMGLPVDKFIISTNSNNEVPVYLETGIYNKISPSLNCISSAMNVGHPGNLPRIIALYRGVMDQDGKIIREPDLMRMRKDFYPVSVTDEETRETIRRSYRDSGILLEPHGAVAWAGMQKYLNSCLAEELLNTTFFVLETAHPAKFSEEIRKFLNIEPSVPGPLEEILKKPEEYILLENNYDIFRDFILKNYK